MPFAAVYLRHPTAVLSLPTPSRVFAKAPGEKVRHVPRARQPPGLSTLSARDREAVPCAAVSWDCHFVGLRDIDWKVRNVIPCQGMEIAHLILDP
jgi:hypothetical protein